MSGATSFSNGYHVYMKMLLAGGKLFPFQIRGPLQLWYTTFYATNRQPCTKADCKYYIFVLGLQDIEDIAHSLKYQIRQGSNRKLQLSWRHPSSLAAARHLDKHIQDPFSITTMAFATKGFKLIPKTINLDWSNCFQIAGRGCRNHFFSSFHHQLLVRLAHAHTLILSGN